MATEGIAEGLLDLDGVHKGSLDYDSDAYTKASLKAYLNPMVEWMVLREARLTWMTLQMARLKPHLIPLAPAMA